VSGANDAGLVTFRRNGRSLIYAAEYAAMNRLVGYLMEHCCRGDASACDVDVCEPSSTVTHEQTSPP
jgi:ArsR family transcriptional regulator, arsenate/arsenite/antimonite-responsive transcriptional repressor